MGNVLKVAILTGLMAVAGAAIAAETPTAGAGGASGGASGGTGAKNDGNACDLDTVTKNFESRGSGGYSADNKRGYKGAYQMGGAALTDIGYKVEVSEGVYKWKGTDGIWNDKDWSNRPDIQEKAQQLWKAKQSDYIKDFENKYIGQDASKYGCSGGKVTHESILAAAHLVGHVGARKYMESGGACNDATSDGNGQCARVRLCAMSNCEPVQKDYSKKTCDVTMPMIEAIDCSKFPAGDLQNLCNYARPHLMTRAECNAAESWAERAPKGPQKESCEGQTFGPGTGSWSYVLACSYMDAWVAGAPANADNDGVPNVFQGGPARDPECYNKLRAKGVNFREAGRIGTGDYNGTQCWVENAVYTSGSPQSIKTIPLLMTCETALALEEFGKIMRGNGVKGYKNYSSVRKCMSMVDDRGAYKSKLPTRHALGQAVDIEYLISDSLGEVRLSQMRDNPGSPGGVLALTARQVGCSQFRMVLSPLYEKYKKQHHFHLEQSEGKNNSCN